MTADPWAHDPEANRLDTHDDRWYCGADYEHGIHMLTTNAGARMCCGAPWRPRTFVAPRLPAEVPPGARCSADTFGYSHTDGTGCVGALCAWWATPAGVRTTAIAEAASAGRLVVRHCDDPRQHDEHTNPIDGGRTLVCPGTPAPEVDAWAMLDATPRRPSMLSIDTDPPEVLAAGRANLLGLDAAGRPAKHRRRGPSGDWLAVAAGSVGGAVVAAGAGWVGVVGSVIVLAVVGAWDWRSGRG